MRETGESATEVFILQDLIRRAGEYINIGAVLAESVVNTKNDISKGPFFYDLANNYLIYDDDSKILLQFPEAMPPSFNNPKNIKVYTWLIQQAKTRADKTQRAWTQLGGRYRFSVKSVTKENLLGVLDSLDPNRKMNILKVFLIALPHQTVV